MTARRVHRAAVWAVVAAVAAGCGDGENAPFTSDAPVYGESRELGGGVLRLYFGSGASPRIERVDLRLLGERKAAVQVRVVEEGSGPGALVVHCVDVDVGQQVAGRRIVDADGTRLEPWGGLDRTAIDGRGCERVRGNVVERFTPVDQPRSQ